MLSINSNQIPVININQSKDGDQDNNNLVVGIDFGTTNSVIAISKNNQTDTIYCFNERDLLPSIICIEDNKFIIKEKENITNNDKVIFSIKRLLGKSTSEILASSILKRLLHNLELNINSQIPSIRLENKDIPLNIIASKIFEYLKNSAESTLNKKLKKIVLTVPAYFDDSAKGQVILAAKIAGFDVVRVMQEPTAAAYAYGLNKSVSGKYLVYDLGGGTFDVSILRMQDGVFQVIAISGDAALGGDDIDNLLAEHFSKKHNIPLTTGLILDVKKIKEELSVKDISTFEHKYNNINIILEISIEEFEVIISSLIDRTIKIIKDIIFDNDINDLDGIILVGGSTRVRCIIQKLKKNFNIPIYNDIDPDRAVALGAAMQADNLTNKESNKNLLIDVVPLSIGLELYGGVVDKIILRNTPTPISITKEFTTYVDNQTAMSFHIVQGERELAKDCKSLLKFELKNLPAKLAGIIKVEITFSIDASGVLSISAIEKTTAIAHNVEIKPTHTLTYDQINEILDEAYSNVEIDHYNKLLTETKVEANSLINRLNQLMIGSENIINQKDFNKINDVIQDLNNILNSQNKERELILDKIDNLKKVSHVLLQAKADYDINKLLQGKKISDFNE